MSFLLWTEEDRTAIDLGDPFDLFAAFAELARTAGPEGDRLYPQLYATTLLGEQTVDPDWLENASRQAANFLAAHGESLSDHAVWVLRKLATRDTGDLPAEEPSGDSDAD